MPESPLSFRLLVLAFASASSLALVGCNRCSSTGTAPSPSASVTALAAPHVIATDELSSPSAFELVANADGLHLLWANAKQAPGWLQQADLAQAGTVRARRSLPVPARTLGKVTDLSATFVAEGLALAWVEQGANEARAAATLLVDTGPPALVDLGAAALSAESARGNIAIVAEQARGPHRAHRGDRPDARRHPVGAHR